MGKRWRNCVRAMAQTCKEIKFVDTGVFEKIASTYSYPSEYLTQEGDFFGPPVSAYRALDLLRQQIDREKLERM